jgi:hypothetical protein
LEELVVGSAIQYDRDSGYTFVCKDGGFNRTDRLLRYPLGSAQRYYTIHYLADVGGHKGHDQYLYEHPNGLFIVGLGEAEKIVWGVLLL